MNAEEGATPVQIDDANERPCPKCGAQNLHAESDTSATCLKCGYEFDPGEPARSSSQAEREAMTAEEHYDWAVSRAMEYVERNSGSAAMACFISDLRKHEGTAGIFTEVLRGLFLLEIMRDGAVGARRFIEGFPRPVTS